MTNSKMSGLFLFFVIACQSNAASQYELPADGNEHEAEAENEAESEGFEGEDEGAVICEKQNYTDDQFNAAFETARQALAKQGYAISPAAWNNEDEFGWIVEAMLTALECVPEELVSTRRYGGTTCERVTNLSIYQDDVAYCGGGAWRGSLVGCSTQGSVLRLFTVNPGTCLNEVCWQHDRCYEAISADCLWSNATEKCDAEFHRGALFCTTRPGRCGFFCKLTMAIAVNLQLLQEAGKLQGYECLYGSCLEGRADCDNNQDNGCEVFLNTDAENCGRCENSCDDAEVCTADACSSGSCTHTLADCDCLDGDAQSCGSDVGVCVSGLQTCVGGRWSACTGAVGPSDEVCDSADNDCDGEVDEERVCEGWIAISVIGAPTARYDHAAIWTGEEMVIWGGVDNVSFGPVNTGGRYNPATDTWLPISTAGAPSARSRPPAVWTGSEMIVWGGCSDVLCNVGINNGGRYNPFTDTWLPTSMVGAPSARREHTAVWTGSEMIVWGGYISTGGKYDPAADSWSVTTTVGAPSTSYLHTAVWTGSEMIVWGGRGERYVDTGGRYDPIANSWIPITTEYEDVARGRHTAVWTGEEMAIGGGVQYIGQPFNGILYNPVDDNWRRMAVYGCIQRSYHSAVWTGLEMIMWGGYNVADGIINTGGRYNPFTNTWSATSTGDAPSERWKHTAIWTGTEMIVWGGNINTVEFSTIFNTGARYTPP